MLIGHRSGRMTKATFLGLENVNHVCLLFLDLSSDHGTMPMALPLVLRATLGLYDFEMGNKCSLILAKGPRRSNSTSGSTHLYCCRLPTHQKKFPITPITTQIHLHSAADYLPTRKNSPSPVLPPQSTYTVLQMTYPPEIIPHHPYHHPSPPTKCCRSPTHQK